MLRVVFGIVWLGQDHPNFELGFRFYLRECRLTVYWGFGKFRRKHLCFSIIHHDFLVLILLTQCWVAFIFQVKFEGLLRCILVNGWIPSNRQCLVNETWLSTHSVTSSIYYSKRGHLFNCTDLDISKLLLRVDCVMLFLLYHWLLFFMALWEFFYWKGTLVELALTLRRRHCFIVRQLCLDLVLGKT